MLYASKSDVFCFFNLSVCYLFVGFAFGTRLGVNAPVGLSCFVFLSFFFMFVLFCFVVVVVVVFVFCLTKG